MVESEAEMGDGGDQSSRGGLEGWRGREGPRDDSTSDSEEPTSYHQAAGKRSLDDGKYVWGD